MESQRIEIPEKLIPIFQGKADIRGAYGGRGSGKTMTFALMTAIKALELDSQGKEGIILGAREFMNSLDDSSLAEIKYAIRQYDWLAAHFDIGEKYIRTKSKRIRYAFAGLDTNIDSIKSKARIWVTWIDEAENVTENAYLTLIPTIRQDDSELWLTWNPKSPESATHKRFRLIQDDLIKVTGINWNDNPWFPEKLDRERLRHFKNDPVTYNHVWEGEFLVLSDAQVLNGKWEVKEFEPQHNWGRALFGADFGFSQDPATLLKCWVYNDCLWIEHEAYKTGVELEDYPRFYDTISQARTSVIYADNSRPETISYIKSKGFNIKPCSKWAGSVEDGIAHLRGAYKRIYIHPRCTNTIKEATLYQYKVDKKTGNITSDIIDANNHAIDALRYALNDRIKKKSGSF